MYEVSLTARPPSDLLAVVASERLDDLIDGRAASVREALAGRSVIHVNSTEAGGGVAEMLNVLLPYARGGGIDARWFVLEGDAEFFAITKRLHHRLHGSEGDGGPLGPHEADVLARVAEENSEALMAALVPGDVLVLHDPQPIGLAAIASSKGIPVVWRCHVGTDAANEYTNEVWDFLRPFLDEPVDGFVFTRDSYAPDWIDRDRLVIIRPSIDPLSPKNQPMKPATALRVLRHVGIVDGGASSPVRFQRRDGSPGRVTRYADVIRTGPPPNDDAPLVVQVSRWDSLKDMAGVMHAFVDHVLDGTAAHLVLAGPAVRSIADDPEAADVLQDVWGQWRALPHAARSRVQLVCLPMHDGEENAAIVNALQRHATVVVQKSLQEGFGLTVTEALWKGKAVVASGVGGIVDQITDGVDGRLVTDPFDLEAFGAATAQLLGSAADRERLGAAARQRVIDEFLPDSSLDQWAEVVLRAIGRRGESAGG
jgi:trehalose synthase